MRAWTAAPAWVRFCLVGLLGGLAAGVAVDHRRNRGVRAALARAPAGTTPLVRRAAWRGPVPADPEVRRAAHALVVARLEQEEGWRRVHAAVVFSLVGLLCLLMSVVECSAWPPLRPPVWRTSGTSGACWSARSCWPAPRSGEPVARGPR